MKTKSHAAAQAQAARRKRGMTKPEVAEAMRRRGHDWTESTVTGVENDRRLMRGEDEMADYAEVLGVQIGDIWPRLAPIRFTRSTSPAPRGITTLPPVTAATPLRAAA